MTGTDAPVPTYQRIIEIGHELLALDSALAQAKVEWGNQHSGDRYGFYDTAISIRLNAMRTQLRRELLPGEKS